MEANKIVKIYRERTKRGNWLTQAFDDAQARNRDDLDYWRCKMAMVCNTPYKLDAYVLSMKIKIDKMIS